MDHSNIWASGITVDEVWNKRSHWGLWAKVNAIGTAQIDICTDKLSAVHIGFRGAEGQCGTGASLGAVPLASVARGRHLTLTSY